MRLYSLTLLAVLAAAPANAFVAPGMPKSYQQQQQRQQTSLEVIRSKNFKNAKLIKPEVDGAGLAKAVVSSTLHVLN